MISPVYLQKHMAHFCDLSADEVLQIERGRTPDCRKHDHISKRRAEQLCEGGGAWLVAKGRIRRNTEMEWTGARSGGFAVMQLRPVYRDKTRQAGGGHTPCGKHRAPYIPPGRSVGVSA